MLVLISVSSLLLKEVAWFILHTRELIYIGSDDKVGICLCFFVCVCSRCGAKNITRFILSFGSEDRTSGIIACVWACATVCLFAYSR